MDALELDLQIGDRLQLQPVQQKDAPRHGVTLIGMLPHQSLIVAAPEASGRLVSVREGQHFVARLFMGDRVIGFNCRVLRACSHPYPYLHLSYPESLEQVTVRAARRVHVQAPVKILRDSGLVPARLVDISLSGAQIVAAEPLGAVGDMLELQASLPIARLGTTGAVFKAIIRNTCEDADAADAALRFRHGVQFVEVSMQAGLVLRACVYERMAGGSRGA